MCSREDFAPICFKRGMFRWTFVSINLVSAQRRVERRMWGLKHSHIGVLWPLPFLCQNSTSEAREKRIVGHCDVYLSCWNPDHQICSSGPEKHCPLQRGKKGGKRLALCCFTPKKMKLERTQTKGRTLFSMQALNFHKTSTTNKLKVENSAIPLCDARSLPPQASGVTFRDKQRPWRMLQACTDNVRGVCTCKCVRVCTVSAALCNRGRKSQDDGGFQHWAAAVEEACALYVFLPPPRCLRSCHVSDTPSARSLEVRFDLSMQPLRMDLQSPSLCIISFISGKYCELPDVLSAADNHLVRRDSCNVIGWLRQHLLGE